MSKKMSFLQLALVERVCNYVVTRLPIGRLNWNWMLNIVSQYLKLEGKME